jgi:hypothetical protein
MYEIVVKDILIDLLLGERSSNFENTSNRGKWSAWF